MNLVTLGTSYTGVIRQVVFCDWLTSFSMMLSRSIHVVITCSMRFFTYTNLALLAAFGKLDLLLPAVFPYGDGDELGSSCPP